MDPNVAKLVREQRLMEAGKLASTLGNAHDASVIYERACEWSAAAKEAIRAGEPARGLELAIHGGDESAADQAIALLVRDKAAARDAAAHLARRGKHAWAARILEGSGSPLEAARAWERVGDACRAAGLLDRAGASADAERVLQAALRREPNALGVAVALGSLLARFGKWEAAVRVLQRVPRGASERPAALAHLGRALHELGFAHAATDVTSELLSLRAGAPSCSDPHRATATGQAPSYSTRLFGRYDVVREVAATARARVLECVDVVRGERVAVKMFTSEGHAGHPGMALFEREIRSMRSIDHPATVRVREVFPEAPAVVLDWMVGDTLERMLETCGAFAPARAIEITDAVLSALGAAHRLGIVHGDAKPANVLFDGAGGAHLSDFGVGYLAAASATVTGGLVGSLAYKAPEQREGRPPSVGGDVFAAGVMLREMLTGEKPNACDAPSRQPSEVHHGLDSRHDTVVARMSASDARQRPADTFEARALLAALAWPGSIDHSVTRPRVGLESSAEPVTTRVDVRADGTALDLWTGRAIEPLLLTEQALERARAFALADHIGLQAVWRADQETATIWLEKLAAGPLARPLTAEERSRLEGALDALHAAGAAHGLVDRDHVLLGPSGPVLRFEGPSLPERSCEPPNAERDATAAAERDRHALARL